MKRMKYVLHYKILICLSLISAVCSFPCGCAKYLAAKPDKTQLVIDNLQECQAVLDDYFQMNVLYPVTLIVAADDYYLTDANYVTKVLNSQTNYRWDKDAVATQDWASLYAIVTNSNVVLDALSKIEVSNVDSFNNVKGQALFFRAFCFYNAAQLWCRPYSSTATSDPGIAMRLTADISVPTFRPTVQQTYDQIINDLKEALLLLSNKIPNNTPRPNKAATYGVLARTYLSMRDYINAGLYADSCLHLYNMLIDYNTVNPSSSVSFKRFNPEMISFARLVVLDIPTSTAYVDTALYNSYTGNDLRQNVFFVKNANGSVNFKGSYDGTQGKGVPFTGIGTDEMYLTRAECSARNGNKDSAMADLNSLLVKRWKSGTFSPYTAIDATDALQQILAERRKELIFRGLRWPDLRRLNLENANITLTRVINGTTYTLPPNDLRWVLLFPQTQVIDLTGLQQNPR